jgi:hypothetical protein
MDQNIATYSSQLGSEFQSVQWISPRSICPLQWTYRGKSTDGRRSKRSVEPSLRDRNQSSLQKSLEFGVEADSGKQKNYAVGLAIGFK